LCGWLQFFADGASLASNIDIESKTIKTLPRCAAIPAINSVPRLFLSESCRHPALRATFAKPKAPQNCLCLEKYSEFMNKTAFERLPNRKAFANRPHLPSAEGNFGPT
jgi:hypothetical protein